MQSANDLVNAASCKNLVEVECATLWPGKKCCTSQKKVEAEISQKKMPKAKNDFKDVIEEMCCCAQIVKEIVDQGFFPPISQVRIVWKEKKASKHLVLARRADAPRGEGYRPQFSSAPAASRKKSKEKIPH